MEISEEQKRIIETDKSKVVVIASAASGKTTVLVERVKFLLKKGVNPKDIVLITFTNAAAGELGDRLGKPDGLFIGTIHSYANYLLTSRGEDTSYYLEKEMFDKLFDMVKKHPNCLRPVKHLLLDESQDSNEIHFEFLLDKIQPENYMLVGDHKQSIYRWNGALPDYIINLTKDPTVTSYHLSNNYRNGEDILDYAKSIINTAGMDYADFSIPKKGTKGKVIGVELDENAIARDIKKIGHYGDWFVLTRTNSQIEEMTSALIRSGVPCQTFKRKELDNKELSKRMKEDSVKVLTIHTAKGLEANYVVVVGAKFYNLEEKCISYVAATRAKDILVWTHAKPKRLKDRRVKIWSY